MTAARTVPAVALAFTLAVAAPAGASANCGPAADVDPAGASLHAARTATICLLNTQRRRHHEGALRSNRKLALAAVRHARDMVDHRYFSHDAPSGENFVQRIMSTHYIPASASWFLGENLAWGSLERSTPRQIVRAWMASPGHRRNILTGGFREIGIAVVAGAPAGGVAQAATYATEFGAVHRH